MRTLREQIAERCRHFTGARNEKCEAGVAYLSLRGAAGEKPSWKTYPCFAGEGRMDCAHRSFPTAGEVEAEVKSCDDSMARVLKARAAIVASGLTHGAIACPCCGVEGSLRFSVAPSNGHIHAACTSRCVSWME